MKNSYDHRSPPIGSGYIILSKNTDSIRSPLAKISKNGLILFLPVYNSLLHSHSPYSKSLRPHSIWHHFSQHSDIKTSTQHGSAHRIRHQFITTLSATQGRPSHQRRCKPHSSRTRHPTRILRGMACNNPQQHAGGSIVSNIHHRARILASPESLKSYLNGKLVAAGGRCRP